MSWRKSFSKPMINAWHNCRLSIVDCRFARRREFTQCQSAIVLRGWLAALLVAIGPVSTTLAAQSGFAAEHPIELDRKMASKLLQRQVTPEYPSVARVNYIRGQVRMLVRVGRSGRVSFAHVVQGHAFLAASALKAIRLWVYRPLMTASGPAEFQTMVDVNFTLRSIKVDRLPPDPDQDLTRQVRPPEALERPPGDTSADCVRMRVLVNDGGQAIDATPLAGPPSLFQGARERIEGWKFRPARWGNLKVPWYVDVSVPMDDVEPDEEKTESLRTTPTG
jgi:TonB family protein